MTADNTDEWANYKDDDKDPRVVSDIEDMVDSTGKLINQNLAYDCLMNSEVSVQLGDERTVGKVTKQALGPNR